MRDAGLVCRDDWEQCWRRRLVPMGQVYLTGLTEKLTCGFIPRQPCVAGKPAGAVIQTHSV